MEFHYKGYTGVMEDGILSLDMIPEQLSGRGKVRLGRDVVTFVGEGETLEELDADAERTFRYSVDCYLESCTERGEAPERPTDV